MCKKAGRLYKFISLNTFAVSTIRVWRPTARNGETPGAPDQATAAQADKAGRTHAL